jgi:hypothetical protein
LRDCVATMFCHCEHLTLALRFGVVHERNLSQETPLASLLAIIKGGNRDWRGLG